MKVSATYLDVFWHWHCRVPQRASVCCCLLPDCLPSARTLREGDFPSFHTERWQYGLGQRSDPLDAPRSEEGTEEEKRNLWKFPAHPHTTNQGPYRVYMNFWNVLLYTVYNSSKVRLSYSYTVAVLFSLNLSPPRSRTVCVCVCARACVCVC